MSEQSFLTTDFGYIVSWSATQLPWLAVGVVGLVLVGVRRSSLPGSAAGLAVTGCVVVLAGVASFIAWIGGLDRLFRLGLIPLDRFEHLNLAVGLVVTIIQAAGGGLLLAAALAGRRRASLPDPPSAGPVIQGR